MRSRGCRDVTAVFGSVKTNLMRGIVSGAVLDARAGQPCAENLRMMIATRAFCAGGAAKLGAEHDEHVLQHAALLEVFE